MVEFCSNCGTYLKPQTIGEKVRYVCKKCNLEHEIIYYNGNRILKPLKNNVKEIVGSSVEEAPPEALKFKSQTEETFPVAEKREIIGRVTLTETTPATSTYFYFWVKDDPSIHVEPGTLVTAVGENTRIIGLVDEIKAIRSVPSPLDDFYGRGYGNPEARMATERSTIRVCGAEIVYREDRRAEPPLGDWPVYLATENEIEIAYNVEISEENRILAGFTYDNERKPIPIYLHAEYVLGYQGAHINISGASGLATKTSYALFLIMGILSLSKHKGYKVGVLLFNVKELDLLTIDQFPARNLESIWQLLEENGYEAHKQLWEKALQDKLDPFVFENIRIFKPEIPALDMKEAGKIVFFNYGFQDLRSIGSSALRMLFEKEDIDDKVLTLLDGIVDVYKNESFKDLLKEISQKLITSSKSSWIYLGNTVHHKDTVNKVLNRLNGAINSLSNLIQKDEPYGQPIPIDELKPNDCWVIDIHELPDKGKRLVFLSTLNIISQILEAKKAGKKEINLMGKSINIDNFPERIVVFVDELNKFAPSGREASPIKAPIVEIATRGRSIGLSLIGAEQLASQIDDEVLTNTSTLVVGRSHPLEVRGATYDWLEKGLKERSFTLKKGEMIIRHSIHNRPIIVHFPIPLHYLKK